MVAGRRPGLSMAPGAAREHPCVPPPPPPLGRRPLRHRRRAGASTRPAPPAGSVDHSAERMQGGSRLAGLRLAWVCTPAQPTTRAEPHRPYRLLKIRSVSDRAARAAEDEMARPQAKPSAARAPGPAPVALPMQASMDDRYTAWAGRQPSGISSAAAPPLTCPAASRHERKMPAPPVETAWLAGRPSLFDLQLQAWRLRECSCRAIPDVARLHGSSTHPLMHPPLSCTARL